jgi:hypothetical protein
VLPSALLITRKRRGRVWPVFVELTQENLAMASDLIRVFKGSVGRRWGDIKEDLEGIETRMDRVDYRFVRGLKTLLERRCRFQEESIVDPSLARRRVFEEAARRGPVTMDTRRREVLERVAAELGITHQELEDSLWADYEDQTVLRRFEDISPENLLRSYNLSLTQTLLFKANYVQVSLGSGSDYRRLFQRVKRLGLMYHCEKKDGRFSITIEGPLALFKMTEKYGTAMAKLVPEIVASASWLLKAGIVMRDYDRTPRSLIFELDDTHANLLGRATPESVEGEKIKEVYDSSVEERFAKTFAALDTGWTITREPEPLVAGQRVFIPDFGFRKRGMTFYMEVVGFWTGEYLRKKLEKLRQLEEWNMILAVDRSLACSEFEEMGREGEWRVVYYDRWVPVQDVVRILRRYEEENLKKEVAALSQVDVALQGDVIRVAELAERYNVGKKAMTERVKTEGGYVLVGEELINQEKLECLKEKLRSIGPSMKYAVVEEMVKEEGIQSVSALLNLLGYEVKWHTLNPTDAVVVRKRGYR